MGIAIVLVTPVELQLRNLQSQNGIWKPKCFTLILSTVNYVTDAMTQKDMPQCEPSKPGNSGRLILLAAGS